MAGIIYPFWLRKFIGDFFTDLSGALPHRQLKFHEIEEYFEINPEFEARWRKFNKYDGGGEPGLFKTRLVALSQALTFINAAVSNDLHTIDNIAHKPEVILAACVLPVEAGGGFDLKRFVDHVNDFQTFIVGNF